MSVLAVAVKHLVALGMSGEALAAAISEMEDAQDNRSVGARRTARWRDRHKASQSVTCDESDGIVTPPPLDKKAPHTPKELIPPVHTHGEARAWACPAGVGAIHWRDFRANRRKKKLTDTETAYAGQLRLLERFASDEWPPGRLVERAAEKGWGTIVDPADYEQNGHRNGQRNGNSNGFDRNEIQNPMLRAAIRSAEARGSG